MRMRENYENDPLADQHNQNCSSLFMCIPRHLGCNGEPNCLEGDASDETGCKSTSRIIMMMIMMIMMMVKVVVVMIFCPGILPYVLFTTGGVVLTITLVASAACLFQVFSHFGSSLDLVVVWISFTMVSTVSYAML